MFKHLVRLSVIAEEIQESHPEASRLIDNTISDVADTGFSGHGMGNKEFPPIPTPSTDDTTSKLESAGEPMSFDGGLDSGGGDTEQAARTVIDGLKQNPDFIQMMERVKNGEDSPESLGELVRQKISETLGANSQTY